jgi:hypothetical protein
MLQGCVSHIMCFMSTIRLAARVCQAQNVCFMKTIRLAERVYQAQNVCFMKTIRLAERVCQAQNICFISTTNSFQNIFFSVSMYIVALFYQTTFLSNFPLARFTHKTSARNKQRVFFVCLAFLRDEDKHIYRLFWTWGVTCVIYNGPYCWTLCY